MEHRTLLVNGLRLHYTVAGAGPDIVFVHGWASSRRMWTSLLPDLSRRYRCWTLDLPGFGDSEKPAQGWYSIPNFTATLLEFMRQLGLERPRLVGHSMGGMIALNLAARHPETIARLVAINPVVTGRASLKPLARPDYSRRVLSWVLRLSPALLQPLLIHPLGHRVSGLTYFRRRNEDFVKATPDSLLSAGRAIVDYDVAPLLERVSVPALVIVGTLDPTVPPAEGRLAAARISGSRLHLMRAGHLLTDDRPVETLRVLQEFLA
ncbi:MAG: alpha/beta hydrolase [Anaerolineales bacterium]|nr:alpha/beta hydrolase [Anaerolineales bacterium]